MRYKRAPNRLRSLKRWTLRGSGRANGRPTNRVLGRDKIGNALARDSVYIHPTADVSGEATVGAGTKIWHQAQVREGAALGKHCVLGKGAYIDKDVTIGDYCKVQNGVSVFQGFNLE